MPRAPLAVLDLVPVSSGSNNSEALRNAVDLARVTERAGYQRYWFAEHHLNPGVIGVSPALCIALVAGATSTIRLGSAGVQFGHRTPLSVAEEFGLLAAAYPGRLDLGLGRSIGRPVPAGATSGSDGGGAAAERVPVAAAAASYRAQTGGGAHTTAEYADNGLLVPKRFDFTKLLGSPRLALTLSLLQQPGAYTPPYDQQIDELLALLRGTYRSADGYDAHANPGEGAPLELWILGASGGSSAEVAGQRGLRFAASYHHSPSTVLDA
ncbi:MAG TPA: LLM class flavin-dependent oxidoreductase, partial [Acidimicrobiales bacterium]|nr:LLM class flavin-dependent oxidoreductase [Acidimicrobiales bacterium]